MNEVKIKVHQQMRKLYNSTWSLVNRETRVLNIVIQLKSNITRNNIQTCNK